MNNFRLFLEIIIALWGGTQFLRSCRVKEGPEMRRMHLLAGTFGLSSGLSLVGLEHFNGIITALFVVLAVCCGGAWLYAVYIHSHHNTTM